jgi:hypothetical protein
LSQRSATFVDQALSSATNFGASALVAGLLTAPDFGAYAIVFTVYLFALGISRAWTSDPLLVMWSATDDETAAEGAVIRAGCVAALIGCGGGLLAVLVGSVVPGRTGPGLMVLGPFLPFALAQDVWRYGLVMLKRPWRACAYDGLWLVIAITLIMVLRLSNQRDLSLAVVAWALGVVPGAILGFSQVSRTRHALVVIQWIASVRHLALRMSAEFLVLTVSGYLMIVVLSSLGSLDDAAAVRSAQILMGPVTVMFIGGTMYFVPEIARAGMTRGRRIARVQSVALTAVATMWLVGAMLIPDSVGTRVFGASWRGARDLLPLVGLSFIGNALTTGATSGLRAFGRASLSLWLRVTAAVFILLSTCIGATESIPRGALKGFAVGSCLAAATWWIGFVLGTRAPSVSSNEPTI